MILFCCYFCYLTVQTIGLHYNYQQLKLKCEFANTNDKISTSLRLRSWDVMVCTNYKQIYICSAIYLNYNILWHHWLSIAKAKALDSYKQHTHNHFTALLDLVRDYSLSQGHENKTACDPSNLKMSSEWFRLCQLAHKEILLLFK